MNRFAPSHPVDPVTKSIRNQQQADAMPSPDEIKRQQNKSNVIHAQLKAVEAFLTHYEAPKSAFLVQCIAELSNFSLLAARARKAHSWGDFRTKHQEPHERSNNTRPAPSPPVQITDEIRETKQNTFLTVQTLIHNVQSVHYESKIINPFGARRAWVVAVEHQFNQHTTRDQSRHQTVFTNDTFNAVMDADQWRPDFNDDTIEKYQTELITLRNDVLTR